MSRKTGAKTKKCLLFLFYRIDNVYYFCSIELIMSTISVFKTDSVYLSSLFSMSILTRNKLEDWQLLLGISTLAGLWVPVTRALRDHVMGIDRTSDGHSLPVLWASSAHFVGWFLGTVLSKRICSFLYFVDYNFVFLYNALWWFDDTSIEIMILLWYFFVKIFGSVILQIVMYQ